jgi:hypothetical protein
MGVEPAADEPEPCDWVPVCEFWHPDSVRQKTNGASAFSQGYFMPALFHWNGKNSILAGAEPFDFGKLGKNGKRPVCH